MKVFRRMLVFRGIAASDVAARHTEPQMDPRVAQLDALVAHVYAGFNVLDLIHVRAFLHVLPS
jgi:hypothetical protein